MYNMIDICKRKIPFYILTYSTKQVTPGLVIKKMYVFA